MPLVTEGGKLESVFRTIKSLSPQQIILFTGTILLIRFIVRGIYRVYFHPLSRFPGPKLSAFTRIPHLYATATGTLHQYVARLSTQYGDIVRISPDELSFVGPQSLRDIYGYGSKGGQGSQPPKHFHRYGKIVGSHESLVTTQSNAEHGRVRRIFSPAFSDRALTQQEPLFLKYVNQLISVLKEDIEGTDNGSAQFDMVRMYSKCIANRVDITCADSGPPSFSDFTTFDVMGDLTFGESLHMLDKAEFDPWVKMIFKSVKISTRINCIRNYYPLAAALLNALLDKLFAKTEQESFSHSSSRVTKRLEKGRASEGVDIWNLVLSQEEKGKEGLSRGHMDANASLFMIAGTETTATLLSGLTYLLLKNPEKMTKLKEEIRSTFASSDDISMEALAKLPYVNACIKEGLRRYPPVAVGLPRLTPANGSTICGEFIPPGTTVAGHHIVIYSSPKAFKNPMAFVPERWTGDPEYAEDERSALQPFSMGSRDCLGKNMAYHEMRLILAKVMYHFDFELSPESESWIAQEVYIIWEKRPLMVKLKLANTL
ncbi:cytochrome P450 46A1 [Pyrenochaeta sp. MPI-SDFR-AT-0127]|nr:cytochrome P450 46A1 [Pyrenochaeta sp. MPI-SDFR-AT-0127]